LTFDPALDNLWLERYINHKGWSPETYILANPGDVIVTEQLFCYPKASKKLPGWHREGLSYTRLALEQSSGETVARFKAGLIQSGTVWDLTGGLGVDSFAFSHVANQVHYCEIAEQPFLLAKNNHTLWGAKNILHHNESAEIVLSNIRESDCVYIDPSRRNSTGRAFLLKDCAPDVHALIPALLNKKATILLKVSPLYDLNQLKNEIPTLNEIFVVSVGGEVKEILVRIDGSQNGLIHSVTLPENIHHTRFIAEQHSSRKINSVGQPKQYLHVPDPAIIKAGTIHSLNDSDVFLFWGKSIYVTTDKQYLQGCRTYKVLDTFEYKPKTLKRYLDGKKVNIHKRNFPIEAPQLYKTLGVSMGDDYHLFFTMGTKNERMVCVTTPA